MQNPPLRRLQIESACAFSGTIFEHVTILTADGNLWWWGVNGLSFATEPQKLSGQSSVTGLLGDHTLQLADGTLQDRRTQWIVGLPD